MANAHGPDSADILGHVTLVTGPEEFLNQRAVTAAAGAVRRGEPEAEVSTVGAEQIGRDV